MATRLQRAAYIFKNMGCNGSGFDPGTILHIFKCFLRPITEYGLAICPRSIKNTCQKALSSTLKLVTSGGRSSSSLVLGLFGEIHPVEIRMLTLQYKFLLKSLAKGPDFTLYFARKANDSRPIAGSVFSVLKKNPFWKAREYERVNACYGRRQPVFPTLHELQDDLIQKLCQNYSSAYIFRGKSRNQRKKFRRVWRQLPRPDQRLVMNWVLNRNAGPWLTCPKCSHPAWKHHLELCIWRLPSISDAPSHVEHGLAQCHTEPHMAFIVEGISTMVSSWPVESTNIG